MKFHHTTTSTFINTTPHNNSLILDIQSGEEGLHKGYARFQSLFSQLEIHGAGVSTEDANQKFLRSLPSAWSQVSLIMGTKPGVDSLSFDDLYNNLRVFENDVKGSIALSSSTQNVAFYEQNSSHTCLLIYQVGPQLDHVDLVQLDDRTRRNELGKWQVAMIAIRMKRFTKDEQKNRRKSWKKEEDSKALVTIDGEGVDWTSHSEEDEDYAFDAFFATAQESDTEKKECMLYPTMTGNYMPSGPDIEVDYTQFTYGPKQTQPSESETQTSEFDTCGSNISTKPSELVSEQLSLMNLCRMSNLRSGLMLLSLRSYESDSEMMLLGGMGILLLRPSAGCNWRPQRTQLHKDYPHRALHNKGIVDSGCSRHMTRNKAYLAEYQDFNGGPVAFGGSKGYITGKGPQEANQNAGTKDIIDAGDSEKEDESAQDYFVLPIWSSYSSTIKRSRAEDAGAAPHKHPDLKTDEKPVDKEDQVFLDELERLKRQEKDANDAAEALRKEFAQETENLLIQVRAANATSTNIVNTVSTTVSTASPYDGLSLFDPTNPEQDDLEISALEDIYKTPTDGIFTNSSYDDEGAVADFTNLETVVNVSPISTSRINSFHPSTLILRDPQSVVQTRSKVTKSSGAHAFILIDLPYRKKAIGTKWVYRNKKDERGVVVRNKARLVAQGHRQEEGIDYDEVFAPVARIEAIRIFLAFASYMGFIVYQMDVKSAFLYGKIDEEVYVSQPPSFLDPKYPQKDYKVVKALYGLHQAPKAWYATLSTFLLKNGYRRGTIDKTLFIKKDKHDIILVQVYVDDIIFGSTKKSWCDEFEALMKSRF
ncbi:putative ribonuclease H-like domain-containing protein [Tanacetum coccineum]